MMLTINLIACTKLMLRLRGKTSVLGMRRRCSEKDISRKTAHFLSAFTIEELRGSIVFDE
jgi:hypothetical protein